MKEIDLNTFPRKAHFEYFKDLSYPHFNVCANVDITKFYHFIKQRNKPFFLSFVYVATKIANDIPEFRYRIRDDKIIEHDIVNPSFTIMTSKDVFSFYNAEFIDEFYRFVEFTIANIELHKDEVKIEDEPGTDDTLYITSLPWISFTSVTHPIEMNPVDSVPRITWGKYFKEGDKLLLPLSVQGHHALIDGVHVGRYFEKMQDFLNDPLKYIPNPKQENKEDEYDTRIFRNDLNNRYRKQTNQFKNY
ncbi:chloramphenicol acetyltransferase [Paludicola sp. MB14-C6]|uniref:chloramphenicol acetyltransferase n=1 Tax=Paludihabitans sp. MB14-C6 TaxID=3070656 RepID=UPI0027DB620A|nr:chloramphenicol acetyltransferase [Paludicola sp. MB14-C6]WMJ21976.1 chloramphenicol acetyltransferase [Paludicola sp. MB14-C6]